MKNSYVFEDYPVKLCQLNYNSEIELLKQKFEEKYPELADRFEVVDDELLFTISDTGSIHERNWAVDFLESNANRERPYNGLGIKLSDELYAELFTIFSDNGVVYFESGNDNCIVETVGNYDSRYRFALKENGLHWIEDED